MTDPPRDPDAELATIGAMLADNKVIPEVRDIITTRDFHDRQRARMFHEIIAMHDQGETVDAVTLGPRLGGEFVHRISQSLEKNANTKHAAYYAGIVREMADRRREIELCNLQIAKAADTSKPFVARVSKPPNDPVLTCMADVEPREVSWLWWGRIPAGRISLLVGKPGEGKSMLTTDMAAHITTGTPWPDGSPCPQGSVIFISAEDDPGDTIRPRLDAHHADPSRVQLLSAVRRRTVEGVRETVFTLADVSALEAALEKMTDCRLIVIDPIGSYLGGGTDAHRDNEVRGVLAPVAHLAERYGPSVLVVAHRRKSVGGSADDTALGSRAFTGIARAVWHLVGDKETKGRRLLLPGKNNLSAQGSGLAFSIVPEPARICWERDPVEISADDALAAETGGRGHGTSALDEAIDWLRNALADGPRLGKEVKEAADSERISQRTLERAQKHLGVKGGPDGFRGPWVWQLPDSCTVRQDSAHSAKNETLADCGDTVADSGEDWGEKYFSEKDGHPVKDNP